VAVDRQVSRIDRSLLGDDGNVGRAIVTMLFAMPGPVGMRRRRFPAAPDKAAGKYSSGIIFTLRR